MHNLSVHPDNKKLTETIFYIASNEGSALLSCNTSLTLGLIHSRPQTPLLPPRASLTTSNADHPRKTRAQIQIQKQEITMQTSKSATRCPGQNYSTQACHQPRPHYA